MTFKKLPIKYEMSEDIARTIYKVLGKIPTIKFKKDFELTEKEIDKLHEFFEGLDMSEGEEEENIYL